MPFLGQLINGLTRLVHGPLLQRDDEIKLRNDNFERLTTQLVAGEGIILDGDGQGGFKISITDPRTLTPKHGSKPPRPPLPPPPPPPTHIYVYAYDCDGIEDPEYIQILSSMVDYYVGKVTKIGDKCYVIGGTILNVTPTATMGDLYDDCPECFGCEDAYYNSPCCFDKDAVAIVNVTVTFGSKLDSTDGSCSGSPIGAGPGNITLNESFNVGQGDFAHGLVSLDVSYDGSNVVWDFEDTGVSGIGGDNTVHASGDGTCDGATLSNPFNPVCFATTDNYDVLGTISGSLQVTGNGCCRHTVIANQATATAADCREGPDDDEGTCEELVS